MRRFSSGISPSKPDTVSVSSGEQDYLTYRKETGKGQERRVKPMAEKEYRELSCRDAGADCDFLVRAETPDEIVSVASEHACRVHNICEIAAESRERMIAMMRRVWCGGESAGIEEDGSITLRKEWMEN
jgi:predicted small metal-binding protein